MHFVLRVVEFIADKGVDVFLPQPCAVKQDAVYPVFPRSDQVPLTLQDSYGSVLYLP